MIEGGFDYKKPLRVHLLDCLLRKITFFNNSTIKSENKMNPIKLKDRMKTVRMTLIF